MRIDLTGALALTCAACFGVQAFADQLPVQIAPRSLAPFDERKIALQEGKPGDRISGHGSVAADHAFPWIVSLGIRGAPHVVGHFCGGVLIRKDIVLTAAHCVTRKELTQDGKLRMTLLDAHDLDVLVGTNYLSFQGTAINVKQIITHPDYTESADHIPINDVAVLQLENDATERTINVLDGPQAESFLGDPTSRLLIAGWGRTNFGDDQPLSNALLTAYVPITAYSACNGQDLYHGLVQSTMICAGLGVTDACQGDSGGPAMAYIAGSPFPFLAGLVSWGVGCGNTRYPGVYVKVSSFIGWVAQNEP